MGEDSSPIKVMLADAYDLVRAATRLLVKSFGDMQLVAEAGGPPDILASVAEQAPDVLLLDIGFPNEGALELAQAVLAQAPSTRVLMLSMYAGEAFIQRALQLGVAGYLLYQSTADELEDGIHALAAGELYLSPAIARQTPGMRDFRDVVAVSETPLTARHLEILRLVASGLSSKQIAQQLHISPKTVEAHRSKIMQRLDVHGLSGLVRYAIRTGLIGTDEGMLQRLLS